MRVRFLIIASRRYYGFLLKFIFCIVHNIYVWVLHVTGTILEVIQIALNFTAQQNSVAVSFIANVVNFYNLAVS